MLLVCTRSEEAAPKRNEAVYAALIASDTDGISSGLVKCTLLERRKCLGHLMYDTVENMADSESLSAEKIDRKRQSCITCAQGKQSKWHSQRRIAGLFPRLFVLEGRPKESHDSNGPMR